MLLWMENAWALTSHLLRDMIYDMIQFDPLNDLRYDFDCRNMALSSKFLGD